MTARAFLGLGSNVGDRLATLVSACELLAAEPGVRVLASSRVWETEPLGPSQPDFLNAVLEVETPMTPHDLLRACHRVEDAFHRERTIRWGPRTLDVDILCFDDLEIDDPDLTIPHPRLLERAFVLVPLVELAPALVLPNGTAVRDARPTGDVRPFAPPLCPGDPA